jgi:hypothetical protein
MKEPAAMKSHEMDRRLSIPAAHVALLNPPGGKKTWVTQTKW